MVLILARRSRKVIPEELVTSMLWDARDFLIRDLLIFYSIVR